MPPPEWMEYIHILIGTAASAAAALALTRLDPLRKPGAALAVLAVMCAARLGTDLFTLPEAVWFAALPVCAAAIRVLFRANVYYSVFASLLAGFFFGLHRMVCLPLSVEGVLLWIADAAVLAAAGLCCRLPAALLPDASSLPAANDRAQRWKLRTSFLGVGLSLAVADLWVMFAPEALEQLTAGTGWALTLLTAAAAALLLWYIRRLTFSMAERLEALMDKQYQDELLNFMQVIRSQRHDFNFHLRTISSLIGHQQYRECDEYIQQMVETSSKMNDMLPLYHPAASALIHAFWEAALQKGIEFEVSVTSDLAQIPCTIYEVNTIIGNLLQNAIDELEQTRSAGPIRLSIMFRSRYYIIRVTNPCGRTPQEMRDIFQPGYSTKQSHEGLGLATVRRIAERYGGRVLPEFGQGMIHLIVQIPFCV